MVRILASSLLAMSLGACSTLAPTPSAPPAAPASAAAPAAPAPPAGTAQPDAKAVNPAAIQALKDMGTYLQSLKRFEVSIELTGERVLADGQKLQHTATADLEVDRPNKLRTRMHSARSQRDLIYDGKTVTLYTPAQKSYSKAEFADNLAGLVRRLKERFGIELPIADLFLWGTPAAPLDNMESAMNAGQDFVDGELCDHYAFRQGAIDWQIWIANGTKPLPRKLVITNRADDARPQSVTLLDWRLNPKFKESTFTFTPPKGARLAEFVPVKNQ